MNMIFTRRSVRQFLDKEVTKEDVEKLLRAGMQAPSAGNQQPWEFIVVSKKADLVELSDYNPYASCLKNSPLAIIVLGNKDRMKYPEHWEQDLGAVTQNIQLQAVELNLGSVWLGTAPDSQRMSYISKLYSLEENILPYAVIAIGHPKDPEANRFVDRYDQSRVRYI